MSGLRLHADFSANQHLQRYLRELSRDDLNELGDEIGSYMVSQVQKHFEDQKTWFGRRFIRSQAAKDRDGQTLLDTTNLMTSYTHNVLGSKSNVGIEVGSDEAYAAIHHFGGKTGRGHKTKIQKNPVLGINSRDNYEIGSMIFDHYRDKMAAA